MLATLMAGKGRAPMVTDDNLSDDTRARVQEGILGPWTEHLQIMVLLARGQTYAEIAAEMRLAERTVRRRAEALMAAVGARTIIEAIALLLRVGLIKP